MMNYELAIDVDGEPFPVPPQVAGWRVLRAQDGRGRPTLVHARGGRDNGKPLIVRVDASHAELLAAAGAGRYRLEAVDEHRRKVEGVPVACTGPLQAIDDDGDVYADDSIPEVVSGPSGRPIEGLLIQVVQANTQMCKETVGQIGTIMSGLTGLFEAVTRLHLPPLPPPPPPEVIYDGTDGPAVGAASPFGAPEIVQLIIREAVDKVVSKLFEKIAGGNGSDVAGIPFAALFDWRKAAPNPTPSAPAAPAPASAPSAPHAPMPSAPASAPASAPSWPSAPPAPHAVSTPPPPPAPAPAGAVPSRESPPGAAPAETSTPPDLSSAPTQKEITAALNAHVLQVWQGLSPPERARAIQLIERLTDEQRTAWIAQLTRLSVPEAIAHARAFIHAQPPPTPQLPTAKPQGDPS